MIKIRNSFLLFTNIKHRSHRSLENSTKLPSSNSQITNKSNQIKGITSKNHRIRISYSSTVTYSSNTRIEHIYSIMKLDLKLRTHDISFPPSNLFPPSYPTVKVSLKGGKVSLKGRKDVLRSLFPTSIVQPDSLPLWLFLIITG